MQALQASGQASDIRDPFPFRGPDPGEVDNSEHPFMKLLSSIRNAMKQGSEPALDSDSGSKSASPSKGKYKSGATGSAGNGLEGAEAGLQLDARMDTMNPARSLLQTTVKHTQPGGPDPVEQKGKSLASLHEGKLASGQSGDDKKAGLLNSAQAATDPVAGKNRGVAKDGADGQDRVLSDQEKLTALGVRKQGTGAGTPVDGLDEVLARHRRHGLAGSHEGTLVAASGNLNGSTGLSATNRNQNQASLRTKDEADTLVSDAKSAGRRPSRYSVVDMRLKAAASKASQDTSTEGKSSGKPAGSESAGLNGNGFPGTDAAGLQIGNDQSSGGFSEVARGSGNESSYKAPASFAENLASRLHDGGAMDIVRSAQIVLKDGDAGLIRLRLDPESLGGVKIELKMADKQISAKIIVESDLAGEAFRSSLDSLRDAFASSGFETTSIEVEVRDGRAGAGDAGKDDPGKDEDGNANDLYLARKAGELGDSVPAADAAYGRYGVIDLVV
jgi:flagellar hook-length control protein FliK